MLSQTSRYALRILGFPVENQGRRIRGDQIAGATGLPADDRSKILSQLRKQGIGQFRNRGAGSLSLDHLRRIDAEERSDLFHEG